MVIRTGQRGGGEKNYGRCLKIPNVPELSTHLNIDDGPYGMRCDSGETPRYSGAINTVTALSLTVRISRHLRPLLSTPREAI